MTVKYKLTAFDLDGTLLDDLGNIGEKNMHAIKKAAAAGVIFTVVTGRTYYEIPEEVRACSDIKYIIYSDGAVVADNCTKEIMFCKYFDRETLAEIYSLLSGYDAMIELYENGRPVTDKINLSSAALDYYRVDKNYRSIIIKTRTPAESLADIVHSSDKAEIFNVFFRNPHERLSCMRALKDIDAVNFTTSMDNNIEILPQGVSKGKALSRLCDLLVIEQSRVLAVGDSSNDITMFAFAGCAVAPSNAPDDIKRIAGRTACSNNDSIADFICNNFLND